MLLWVFGPMESVIIHHSSPDAVAGLILLKNARVRFFLSINAAHRPSVEGINAMTPYRNLVIDNEPFDYRRIHRFAYVELFQDY